MVREAVRLQPMDINGEVGIHLQSVEDPTLEQVDAPEGGCDCERNPCCTMGMTYGEEFSGGLSPMG